jgi:hypothetical protein
LESVTDEVSSQLLSSVGGASLKFSSLKSLDFLSQQQPAGKLSY